MLSLSVNCTTVTTARSHGISVGCDTTSHTSSKKTTAAYMVCPRIVLLLQQRCLWEEGPTHVSVDVGVWMCEDDESHMCDLKDIKEQGAISAVLCHKTTRNMIAFSESVRSVMRSIFRNGQVLGLFSQNMK